MHLHKKKLSLMLKKGILLNKFNKIKRVNNVSLQVVPPMQNVLSQLDQPLFTVWFDRKVKAVN